MTDHIFYFTGPRTSLDAFINNFGWLQFRFFSIGILVIWATSSFAQESRLNGSDLATLKACFETQLNDAGTINETAANRSGLACMGWAVVRCKTKLFATDYIPKSECPNPEYEGWDDELIQAYHVVIKEAKQAGSLGQSLPSGEVDSLRQMPWTWIGYRGATCHFSHLQFGEGAPGSNRGSRVPVVAHGAAGNFSDQLQLALGEKKLRQL
tara:strand:- start:51 stop:680 length:630 start_codon:yes stop_codon:yes gene_type:complete